MSEKRSTDSAKTRIAALISEAEELAQKAGTEKLRLMAVSKTRTPEEIAAAYHAGIRLFGENRVQEFRTKEETFSALPAEVHLIGHLQRNKAKYVVGKTACIESVDSIPLAETIGEIAAKLGLVQEILIEVNAGYDKNKFGVPPEETAALCERIARLPGVRITGLMTIAPIGPERVAKDAFLRANELFVDIRRKKMDNVDMKILSMGMSSDYRVAIACGSNLIRLGAAVFGER